MYLCAKRISSSQANNSEESQEPCQEKHNMYCTVYYVIARDFRFFIWHSFVSLNLILFSNVVVLPLLFSDFAMSSSFLSLEEHSHFGKSEV